MSGPRARGLLGVLLVLAAREPWALGLGALLLWPRSRRSGTGLLSALGSALLPGLLWGADAAVLCFLSATCAVLAAGLVDPALPARWRVLLEEVRRLRERFRAAGWTGRVSILGELVPGDRARPVKALPELAGWTLLGISLAFLVHVADLPSFSEETGAESERPVYVAETVAGRILLDRPGRYDLAGPSGGITVVHDGAVPRVVASGCAGHLCERQSVRLGGIVCAPNRIVIRRAGRGATGRGADGSGEGIHAWTG